MTHDRKIIQIIPGQYQVFALCNDGTYWQLLGNSKDDQWWEQLPSLPPVPQEKPT